MPDYTIPYVRYKYASASIVSAVHSLLSRINSTLTEQISKSVCHTVAVSTNR